jgi:hypothetical protein
MSTASYKNTALAVMAEALRPVGFHKRGSCFERSLTDVVHLVGLQASTSSTAALLRITANLAIWVPSLADGRDRPDIWSSHWRQRLGELMPERSDRWWTITTEQEAAVAATEITSGLLSYGLPALDSLSSVAALQQVWEAGKSPGLTKTQSQRYVERLHANPKTG